jgi:hypothetical protein
VHAKEDEMDQDIRPGLDQDDAVQPGWEIVGADDQRIGAVSDVEEGYLHFTKGFIASKDVYVPSDAISQVDPGEERVYLNVSKSEIDRLGWNTPPARRTRFGTLDQTGLEDRE